ncbi:hypothetical protein GCM10009630_26290 [Kribbella jejuensis]|uniref:Uncharacterized protein n=1 Tax=Kribbella jejuensis TaxID=236068 RepID=A0A542DUP7_9ACTN|nr:hypothetical protein [Kribbella jejuensis]TQJ06813.1 hypothetical protein FB475_6489 [Kribbella jejuensis]
MNESWAPDACTLPTAERPFRVAEFDQLFATYLRNVNRVDPQTVDLLLEPAAEATAADLIARESECCSFFTFTLSGAVNLRITVPPARTDVLDGLVARL